MQNKSINSPGKVFFDIDFLKFIFVIGMFVRHLTFYLYEGRYIEYGIESLNLFTFFLPVTGAFIFILGYTLALSYKSKISFEEKKYLIIGSKLFAFVLLAALVTYILRVYDNLSITFFNYFFLTQWNEWPKPGFYIILPISLLYFLYYFLLLKSYKVILVTFLFMIVLFAFYDLYIVHYLLFGLIGFGIGYFNNHQLLYDKFIRSRSFIVALILYIGFFLFHYKNVINIWLEIIMLILFILIFDYLSKYIHNKIMKNIIIFTSNNIFLFYIIHIVGLNILSKITNITFTYKGIFIFMFIYFIFVYLLVKTIRHLGVKIL